MVDAVNELNSKVIPISQGGTGASTLEEAKTALGIKEPVVLYSNSMGITGTVTISEVSSNFNYLEIFYRSNSENFSSFRIPNPLSKKASLSISELTDNALKESFLHIVINYVTISVNNSGNITASSTSPELSFSNSDSIRICEVLGYR